MTSVKKNVEQYLDSIKEVDDEDSKVRIAGEMFSYIANNKELLSNKKLSDVIRKKLKHFFYLNHVTEAQKWWNMMFEDKFVVSYDEDDSW
tara:strand:+ start:3825 stop:4094 length:270 start_codon:yes stop_codon:yes gene_type:complete